MPTEKPWPPSPEAYVSRQQLAALMGVSTKTVDRMVKDGLPSETWGRRTRRFLPSVAMAWASSREASPAVGVRTSGGRLPDDVEDQSTPLLIGRPPTTGSPLDTYRRRTA
jgi:phage terminase Nu1 subunit (DNA packaging protein)